MNINKSIILALCTCCLFLSCSNDDSEEGYVPKMRGYFKIDLPPHEYQLLKEKHPFQFEYSKYADVTNDTTGLVGDHWINVSYKDFDADIQLTYKVPKNKKEYLQIVDEHIKLTNKHQVRAYSIEEIQITNPKGKKYFVYELVGDVPSPFQFYATDTTKNFIRGALYFKTSQKNDSLAPVIEYIKEDVVHMLNTLEWRKN